MKTQAFALALLAAALPLAASAQKLVPAGSEIAFTVKQMGVPVDGKFKKWDAQVVFDPKKPEAGKVSLALDTASAGFGVAETDVEIPKPVWFNSAKFPQATFTSTAIKAAGPGKYTVAGKLSIKGSSRDVTVPVTLAAAGANSVATGAFTIKRLEFKIGEGEWADTSMVADEVQVKFKLVLSGLAP
jgi:polyisoprenoid-binding protein YceI